MLHPGDSEAQWILYDDFSGGTIDPAKWFGNESTGGPTNPTTEISRVIESQKLRMLLNQYGSTTSDSGTSGGAVRLSVTSPSGIKGMQAKVAVIQAETDLCLANPSTGVRGRAQIVGALFNDGTGPGSPDRTGDILAGVQKIRDTVLGDVIQPFLVRCSNSTCSSNTGITTTPPLPTTFITTWTPGTKHKMSFLWDKATKTVTYAVKPPASPKEVIAAVYVASDAAVPVLDFKHVDLNLSAANCTSGQTQTLMEATFDLVSTQ
jgi:hypothetical protein